MSEHPDEPTQDAPQPASSGSDGGEREAGAAFRRLTQGTARMAATTAVRQILSVFVLALTAATVARCLGPRSFGLYSGGTAAFNLMLSLVDLGFSLVLIREMTRDPERQARLMSTAFQAQTAWALLLTVGLLIMGLLAGGTRGHVMLVLCPALAFTGLGVSRTIFSVRFRASPLLIVDLSTTMLQCFIMIGLALAHVPVIVLAANVTAWSLITGVLCVLLARKLVTFDRPTLAEVLGFIRTALPLGFASILASLYFSIDLTLLGWLVVPRQLGHYAAAVRILTVVVTVPGFVMAAGIPGLSRAGLDRTELTRFAATLAHWIAASALPLGIGIAVFARPAVLIVFGHSYLAAVPLIRILMLAGVLSFISNVTGIVLMTQSIVRVQIVFNTISLVVNVTGNLLLVPRFGVSVAAWLTVVSEAIVVSYGVFFLRPLVSFRIMVERIWRVALACALAAGVGELLGASDALAMAAAAVTYVALMSVLRAWPEVLTDWLRSRRLAARAA